MASLTTKDLKEFKYYMRGCKIMNVAYVMLQFSLCERQWYLFCPIEEIDHFKSSLKDNLEFFS